MKQNQKFRIARSTEGTIFEIAFVILAVIVWAVIIVMMRHAPETVATHFDATGTPNSWGNKYSLLLPLIITTVVGGCMLLGAYFPHTVNLPVSISNMRQALLAVRMMRILAFIFLLLTLLIAYTSFGNARPSAWPIILIVVLMLGVIALFTALIYKARNRG